MRVFAYCTQAAARAVGKAVGGSTLLTSPPVTAALFDPRWMSGHDVLYFWLHGAPDRPGWYNDAGELALTSIQAGLADLRGAVVVIANCYGAENEAMIEAFYRAGARAVIAGAGPNIAAGNRVVGADLLAQWIVRALRMGASVEHALQVAMARLRVTSFRASDKDALEFRILERKGVKT